MPDNTIPAKEIMLGQPAASISSLKNKDINQYDAGTMCHVIGIGTYEYDPTSVAIGNDITVVQPNVGNGRWLIVTYTLSATSRLAGRISGGGGPVQEIPFSTFLQSANNFSDLGSVTTAQTNLNVPTRTGGNASGTWNISITGNSSTVTTNANLTGAVTSVGNATTIAPTGVSATTYGNATHVPQVAVNAAGQITSASNVLISGVAPAGSAGGALSGTYPNPSLASGINATLIGNGDVTNTELSYINSVTSNVQTQLNAKAALAGATFTGAVVLDGDPITANMAANKAYVDSVASGAQTEDACLLGTTANVSAVYLNGTAGVGATLSVVATGPLTLDGQAANTLNGRYLFKDQTDSFQNGIYTLTTIGDLGISPIYTRATDYDEPSEITVGDLIPILNGDTQAGNIYRQNSTVTTIGTDPITFTLWLGGSTYLQRGNNLSDVASASTSRINLGLEDMATQLSSAVSITGGAMTGMSELGAYAPVSSSLECTNDGILNFIGANASGDLRYAWGANTVESTANLGYNPCLFLYDDAGVFLKTAIFVERATGNITVNGALAASNLSNTNTGDQFTSIATQTLLGNPTGSTAAATSFGIGAGLEFSGGLLTVTGGSSGNIVRFDATVTAAQLNTGIATLFITDSVSYRILNLWINATNTPFSGGGGNEGIVITDGYTQYAFGSATAVSSGLNYVWGSSDLTFPLVGVPINTPTNSAPNSNLIAAYWTGSGTNYATGEIVISGLLQVV